jgi:Chromo (CHRromatin Organisation MOdifier) domain
VNGEEEFEVEMILDVQPQGRGRKMHYLVKWKGYPTSDNSWEPKENVHVEELIKEFYKRNPKHGNTKKRKL